MPGEWPDLVPAEAKFEQISDCTQFDRIQHLYICCTEMHDKGSVYEKYQGDRATALVSQGGAVAYGIRQGN